MSVSAIEAGLRLLATAILKQAVDDVTDPDLPADERPALLTWWQSDRTEGCSLVNCCEALDLEPSAVRAKVPYLRLMFTPRCIRAMRQRLGMSQQDVADRLSVDRTLVACWENGSRPIILAHLIGLKKIFSGSVTNFQEPVFTVV